jgi:uncharacterized protein (TIGR00304 family)
VRWWGLVPAGLLGVGALLVGWAVAEGGAELAIVVIVPVLFGRSIAFVAGVLLLVAGLFTLPLAFEPAEEAEPPTAGGSPAGTHGGSGGVVLIGPVPIFFGSWRNVSPRTRVLAAILGGAVLVVAIALFVLFAR